ncbi:MAG: hypothetical protein K2O99_08460 [Lachnospiraceae bacterium]|nr:hypothetical protein [Lachnospiraceae bacterium]
MSVGKKRILCCAVVIFVILCVFTVVSYRTNIRLMPRVETFPYTPPIFWADEQLKWYLPREALFVNAKGHTVAYRIRERAGRFGREYFVQEVQLDIFLENGREEVREDGHIRVIAPDLEAWDNLVCGSSRFFAEGDAVVWVNPDSDRSGMVAACPRLNYLR